MNKILEESIKHAVVKIEREDLLYDPHLILDQPSLNLIHKVKNLIWSQAQAPRFVFLYGYVSLYRELASNLENKYIQGTHRFFKNLFIAVAQSIEKEFPEMLNPFRAQLGFHEYDLEGYGVNENFKPYSFLEPRESFHTIKCLHFDSAEAVVANIYGPNKNIKGGFPVLADVKAYCHDNGLKISEILERMEGDEPLTIKSDHYKKVLSDYSFCFNFDMTNDMPCVIAFNEVMTGGIAHAATKVEKVDSDKNASRPLRHMTYTYLKKEEITHWYKNMNVETTPLCSKERTEKELFYKHVKEKKQLPYMINAPHTGAER